jgi:hypothetical protein
VTSYNDSGELAPLDFRGDLIQGRGESASWSYCVWLEADLTCEFDNLKVIRLR